MRVKWQESKPFLRGEQALMSELKEEFLMMELFINA